MSQRSATPSHACAYCGRRAEGNFSVHRDEPEAQFCSFQPGCIRPLCFSMHLKGE